MVDDGSKPTKWEQSLQTTRIDLLYLCHPIPIPGYSRIHICMNLIYIDNEKIWIDVVIWIFLAWWPKLISRWVNIINMEFAVMIGWLINIKCSSSTEIRLIHSKSTWNEILYSKHPSTSKPTNPNIKSTTIQINISKLQPTKNISISTHDIVSFEFRRIGSTPKVLKQEKQRQLENRLGVAFWLAALANGIYLAPRSDSWCPKRDAERATLDQMCSIVVTCLYNIAIFIWNTVSFFFLQNEPLKKEKNYKYSKNYTLIPRFVSLSDLPRFVLSARRSLLWRVTPFGHPAVPNKGPWYGRIIIQ